MADALQGTWVFNDEPDIENDLFAYKYYSISFTSNNKTFDSLSYYGQTNTSYLRYTARSEDIDVYEYNFDSGYSLGWTNEAYKTITITSKLSEVTNGDVLLTWLQANATKQAAPSPAYPKINSFTYHGKRINNINGKHIRYVHDKRAGMDNTYEMMYVVQLATPQNVTADGTTVSWDAVENATSYAVFADGVIIAEYTPKPSGYLLLVWSHDYYSSDTDTVAYIKFNGVATSTDYDWKAYTEDLTSYVKDKNGNDVSFSIELNYITNVNIYLAQGEIELLSQSFNTIGNHNIVLSKTKSTYIRMAAYD